MATKSKVPRFVRIANIMTTTLLRAGIKLTGPGSCPLYLLTVPGRKSGLRRTIPIAVVEQEGKRYLLSPYGVVDWTRNLRAAGEATFTRGRRAEDVRALELPLDEAGPVLKRFIETGNPIGRFFPIAANASLDEFKHITATHPVFLLQTPVAASEKIAA